MPFANSNLQYCFISQSKIQSSSLWRQNKKKKKLKPANYLTDLKEPPSKNYKNRGAQKNYNKSKTNCISLCLKRWFPVCQRNLRASFRPGLDIECIWNETLRAVYFKGKPVLLCHMLSANDKKCIFKDVSWICLYIAIMGIELMWYVSKHFV